MSNHFEKYGWVSFLSYIADSRIFDISGMNSIDAAKHTKLYPILVWASEKKEKEELIASYYERLNKK